MGSGGVQRQAFGDVRSRGPRGCRGRNEPLPTIAFNENNFSGTRSSQKRKINTEDDVREEEKGRGEAGGPEATEWGGGTFGI